MNVFRQQAKVHENPNRNNFDLTFKNHLSMKMGTLYPVMCKPTVPGDSFRIDSAFGLRFMPMPFPTQTKMRAHMHFFYVRNKNLWKDFENWIEGLGSADSSARLPVHPYISQSDPDFFKTGSLADYLGVPSTLVSNSVHTSVGQFELYDGAVTSTAFFHASSAQVPSEALAVSPLRPYWFNPTFDPNDIVTPYLNRYLRPYDEDVTVNGGVLAYKTEPFSKPLYATADNDCSFYLNFMAYNGTYSGLNISQLFDNDFDILVTPYFGEGDSAVVVNPSLFNLSNSFTYTGGRILFDQAWCEFFNRGVEQFGSGGFIIYRLPSTASFTPTGGNSVSVVWCLSPNFTPKVPCFCLSESFAFTSEGSDISDISMNPVYNPFLSTNLSQGGCSISALPFRAYESCYYAYYSNSVLQPLLDSNEYPMYNRYNHTIDEGADTTPYHLFTRNWETDFLTSCLPSPQQGNAPLVGMSALGDITMEDGNGISTFHAEVDNDGNISKIVATSPVASTEHARTAMNIAAVGMNINDFRGTNALQRFLEQSLRSGYRYKDFIFGHFGHSPKYSELDMPEFIGGFSRDVQVNIVSQTAQISADSNLGDYAGQASCLGGSKHSINHYCDDYGFIIGIMCVTPTPSYSQLLPHHFLHRDRLDYYFPEFSQIGMRPVTYQEVAPIQAYLDFTQDQNKVLTDTFGYQRPDWDLVSSVDEVHGLFRTDLSTYLVNRIYGSRPELGREFLEIKPEETNNIFTYQEKNGDTIIGEVVMQVYAKRPVPRVVVPSLGR